jgi:type IV pilus assembly protein PilW
MNKQRCTSQSSQRGLSLVELMVSMVIGLFVIGAVLISYLGSGQAASQQAAYSQMNDDAQIGLSIIARDLMLAGYTRPTGVNVATGRFSGTPPMAVFGCDKGFVTPNKLDELVAATDCATTGSSSAIEVIYEADIDNTVAKDAQPSDCVGNTIDKALTPAPWLRNRYYVVNSESTGTARPELHCASNLSNSAGARIGGQPLLENVEVLKAMYLEALLPLKATPLENQRYHYVAASDVAEWGNVLAVRVCLLMRSSDPILTAEDTTHITSKYLDCDLNSATAADKYLRRAYFTTVALRNQISS